MNEPTWRTTPEEWNEVQEEALAVIRKTNPTRTVMVCGIDYSGLVALDNLKIPKDDNLIATSHTLHTYMFLYISYSYISPKTLCFAIHFL